MKPKDDVTIIRRFGEMDAMDNALNKVHCSKKQIMTMIVTVIFRFITSSVPFLFVFFTGYFFVEYDKYFFQMLKIDSRCQRPGFGQVIGIFF